MYVVIFFGGIMNKKTECVFNGWTHLTEDEKKELVDAIKKYEDAGIVEKRRLKELVERSVHLGPLTSDVCPCCGR